MSKTKFAVILFCVAFGLNGLAFLFSKQTFIVEEVKNVWLYELPQTSSPLDAYPALEMGPQQGVIGTLIRPEFSEGASKPVAFLAQGSSWEEKTKTLSFDLMHGLTYSDHTPILAQHWVDSLEWTRSRFATQTATLPPLWQAWLQAKVTAPDATHLEFSWTTLPAGFEVPKFLREVLTNSLSGVIHPKNLEALKAGKAITMDWISSGPYRVRKWSLREIFLISRDDFPIMLPKEFFRTVRYQSAPVKNPSCNFIQSISGTEKELLGELGSSHEHLPVPTTEQLHVFWICRSFKADGKFCQDEKNRDLFARLMKGEKFFAPPLLGKTVYYRIPVGSDAFRAQVRDQIERSVKAGGGKVEEVSYFLKSKIEPDIELEFVLTPKSDQASGLAEALALQSSRFGEMQVQGKNLVGEIMQYPMTVMVKGDRGDIFEKAFLEPDLSEKQMGI